MDAIGSDFHTAEQGHKHRLKFFGHLIHSFLRGRTLRTLTPLILVRIQVPQTVHAEVTFQGRVQHTYRQTTAPFFIEGIDTQPDYGAGSASTNLKEAELKAGITSDQPMVLLLMDPVQYRTWARTMPNLHLSRDEAESVVAYLKWISAVDTNGNVIIGLWLAYISTSGSLHRLISLGHLW